MRTLLGLVLFSARAEKVRVVNHCEVAALVTFDYKADALPVGTSRPITIEAWNSYSKDCLPGMTVKAEVLLFEEYNCTAHAYPLACTFDDGRPTELQLDCAEKDPLKAPNLCTLTDTHQPCNLLSIDRLASYCPPRSSPWNSKKALSSSCPYPALKDDTTLIEKTRCPLCTCDQESSECFGDQCDSCDGTVTRSAISTCKPKKWTLGPTASPVLAPTQHPAEPEKRNPTPEPTTNKGVTQKDENNARRASNMAAFVIALLAAGIAACAIRQAVVKQRSRFHAPRSGLYVDIPSTLPTDGPRSSNGQRRSSGRSSSAIEMMMHGSNNSL